MLKPNKCYGDLQDSYLFYNIAQKIQAYLEAHPDAKLYRMGIGDWWYARRIEFHIRQGNIRVVEDSRKHYARVICRVKS